MGFYEQISKYYDYIFPVGERQLDFIKNAAGEPPKRILDVACGSGGYSVELAKSGYMAAATDVDSSMVELARYKAKGAGMKVDALVCDMRKLGQCFSNKFDCIFCIGNSIVHLGSPDDILNTLKQMHRLLDDGGTLVLQIINYDRIIKYGLSQLPPIINNSAGLEFIREYEYLNENRINFNTVLTVKEGGEKKRFENSIPLLPLKSPDLYRMLEQAGYRNIRFYGDFDYAPYNVDSYMLAAHCDRGRFSTVAF